MHHYSNTEKFINAVLDPGPMILERLKTPNFSPVTRNSVKHRIKNS